MTISWAPPARVASGLAWPAGMVSVHLAHFADEAGFTAIG